MKTQNTTQRRVMNSFRKPAQARCQDIPQVGAAACAVGLVLLMLCVTSLVTSAARGQQEPPKKAQEAKEKPKPAAQKVIAGAIQAIPRAVRNAQQGEEQEDKPAGPFAPPDRGKLRVLRLSVDALEEGRFSDGVQGLAHLLEMQEDYFFRPDPSVTVFRSMKFEAKSLLAKLPEEGREVYEQLYGPQAQRKVDAAVAEGNFQALQDIARTYPYTVAGNQATYLAALRDMDHGEFRGAAMLFQELLGSPGAVAQLEPGLSLNLSHCYSALGDSTSLAKITPTIIQRLESVVWPWNGNKLPMADIIAAMRAPVMTRPPRDMSVYRWPMFGGSADHNSLPRASLPLGNPTWRNTVVAAPKLRRSLLSGTAEVQDRGLPLVSGFFPLLIDGQVIARGLNNEIRSLDAASGELLWKTDFQVPDVLVPPQQEYGVATLRDRLWFDGISGQLATDGNYVFAVEQSWGIDESPGVVGGNTWNKTVSKRMGGQESNQLSAYDISAEGKLAWQLGGSDTRLGENAGTQFLGPPLVQGDTLFLLGEIENGEIRLFAVNANDGSVLYSQYVLSPSQTQFESFRHMAGASLAAQGTIVVCPTSAGAIVAFDRASRQLLWGYSYATKEPQSDSQRLILRINGNQVAENGAEERWRICVPRIVGDLLVVSPADSNELHCLRLSDGELLWTTPREDGVFVAGVESSQAIVVGTKSIKGISLADGGEAWACPLPEAKLPSGLGYFGEGHYYQPLAGESIIAVDTSSGEISETLLARRDARPGNLLVAQDGIISQTPFGLERFPRLDFVKQQNLDAAETLTAADYATRAEVRLLEGNLDAAITDLEASLAADAKPQTRELLFEAYLRGLREDSEKFSPRRARIEDLIVNDDQRGQFLLAIAQGLEARGEGVNAFGVYMQVPRTGIRIPTESVDVAPVWPQRLNLIDANSDVRMSRDAFIAWRLQEIQDQAEAEQLAEMQALVSGLRSEARQLQEQSPQQAISLLARLVHYLPDREDVAYDRLAMMALQRIDVARTSSEVILRREVLLEELAQSRNPALAAPATAHLAHLYQQLNRWDLVSGQAARLAEEFASLECLNGANGAQIAKQLSDQAPAGMDLLNPTNDWPNLAMTADQVGETTLRGNEYSVDWKRPVGSVLSGWNLRLAYPDNILIGLDELGRQRFVCSLTPHLQNQQNVPIYYAHRAWSRGHLLIYSTGAQIVAIDTLTGTTSQEADVLWTLELAQWQSANRGFSFSGTSTGWGEYRYRMNGPNGQPIGKMNLVSPELLCAVRADALLGLDPFTGERIWARGKVSPSTDVYGGRNAVLHAPTNSTKANVISATTGVAGGTRNVTYEQNVMTVHEAKALVWSPGNGGVQLRWIDLNSEETLWEKEFDGRSKGCLLDDEYVVVVEPDWFYTMLRIDDGQVHATGRVPPQAVPEENASLQHVMAQRTGGDFVIAAGANYRPNYGEDGEYRSAISDGINQILLTGVVFGIPKQPQDPGAQEQTPTWSRSLNATTFLKTQPTGVPIITFACRVSDRVNNRTLNHRVEYLLIDTRRGETIFEESINGSANAIRIDSTPERDLIQVRSTLAAIDVRFAEAASDDAPGNQ